MSGYRTLTNLYAWGMKGQPLLWSFAVIGDFMNFIRSAMVSMGPKISFFLWKKLSECHMIRGHNSFSQSLFRFWRDAWNKWALAAILDFRKIFADGKGGKAFDQHGCCCQRQNCILGTSSYIFSWIIYVQMQEQWLNMNINTHCKR